MPQTATVYRDSAKLDQPVYDGGTPQVQAIAGTPLQYVVNTGTAVIMVSGTSWYALQSGIWFTAPSANGPWVRGHLGAGDDLFDSAQFPALLRDLREGVRRHQHRRVRRVHAGLLRSVRHTVRHGGLRHRIRVPGVCHDGLLSAARDLWVRRDDDLFAVRRLGVRLRVGVRSRLLLLSLRLRPDAVLRRLLSVPWLRLWPVRWRGLLWPWRLRRDHGKRLPPVRRHQRGEQHFRRVQRLDRQWLRAPDRAVVQLHDRHLDRRRAQHRGQCVYRQLRLAERGRGLQQPDGSGGGRRAHDAGQRVHRPAGVGHQGRRVQPEHRPGGIGGRDGFRRQLRGARGEQRLRGRQRATCTRARRAVGSSRRRAAGGRART